MDCILRIYKVNLRPDILLEEREKKIIEFNRSLKWRESICIKKIQHTNKKQGQQL
jgi:hypothetical protein